MSVMQSVRLLCGSLNQISLFPPAPPPKCKNQVGLNQLRANHANVSQNFSSGGLVTLSFLPASLRLASPFPPCRVSVAAPFPPVYSLHPLLETGRKAKQNKAE